MTAASYLVTGGTGFLGRRLTEDLAGAGHRVTVLSRRAAPDWLPSGVALLRGDLADLPPLPTVDVVVHAAACTEPDSPRASAFDTNLKGTVALLERLTEQPPRRFVHVSDLAVAGDHVGPLAEDELLVDQRFPTLAVEAKALAERRVRAAMDVVPTTIVRPSQLAFDRRLRSVPRATPLVRLLAFLASLANHPAPLRTVPVAPFGSCARVDAVPVDWVAASIVRLALDPAAAGRTVHLHDPDAPTVRELLDAASSLLGLRPPRLDLPRRVVAPLWASPLAAPLRTLLDEGRNVTDGMLRSLATCAVPAPTGAEQLLRDTPAPRLLDYLPELLEHARRDWG